MNEAFKQLKTYLDEAMAVQTALVLFEWDDATLAPKAAGENTSRVIEILSGQYFKAMTGDETKALVRQCLQDPSGLNEVELAQVKEMEEQIEQLDCIPKEEYQAFAKLSSESVRIWEEAKEQNDFKRFAPTLKKVVEYQKKFAGYRAKEGQSKYDALLKDYEKGFTSKDLDEFFGLLKEEIVPFLKTIMERGRQICDDFLTGEFPEEKQEELGRFLAEYVGFDFSKGVLSVSAHPFTTNLHNKDVRITTSYNDHVDSSLFSVIHEAGHGIYEMGIRDDLTQTVVGQGASMAMHESQSRFFENIIGRSKEFWIPVYGKLQELFPETFENISVEQFTEAINKVHPDLIRTEADELTYSLHVLIRYEIEKMLIEEDLDVDKLPEIWADKYEEYLGVRPQSDKEGVLQDIHWSQGSFGYFPSYALGSAFGAQLYFHMKEVMDFEGLLREGKIDEIREYLRENIHQYGKLKTSRQILKDTTGEDFNPRYYVRYLKEKYSALYHIG
ncbi:MAG: carboxypeptidase M32 [Lachnospiraceae bacterium]|jgi:carboxypeptidase Taq